jgi:hypothetical protein
VYFHKIFRMCHHGCQTCELTRKMVQFYESTQIYRVKSGRKLENQQTRSNSVKLGELGQLRPSLPSLIKLTKTINTSDSFAFTFPENSYY